MKQQKNGCGAAVLAMVMKYWSQRGAVVPADAAAEGRIERTLYSRRAGGIAAGDLVRYLEANGFRAFEFRAHWQDLEDNLSRSRPVVVCLGHRTLHYVVVAGIDPERGLLYVNDPARRKLLKWDRPTFERAWRNHWALLATPQVPH